MICYSQSTCQVRDDSDKRFRKYCISSSELEGCSWCVQHTPSTIEPSLPLSRGDLGGRVRLSDKDRCRELRLERTRVCFVGRYRERRTDPRSGRIVFSLTPSTDNQSISLFLRLTSNLYSPLLSSPSTPLKGSGE